MWIAPAPVSFVDFVEIFPLTRLSSWPFSPRQPLRVPSPLRRPFVDMALARPSWKCFCLLPFVDIFFPLPNPFGRSLSSLFQPLRGPSPFFVALRGYLFAFCPSWTSSSPFPTLHARKPGANAWHNRVGYCGFTGTGGMNEQATHRDGFLCGLSLQASPTGSHSSVE